MMYSPVPASIIQCGGMVLMGVAYSPDVLQATALLFPPTSTLSAQHPHPNMVACPTLPGDLREMPPLETPAATPPFASRQIAPTVSRGARHGVLEGARRWRESASLTARPGPHEEI